MSTIREENYFSNSSLPLILALSSGGEPVRWIDYEKCAYYYTKDKILWTLGSTEIKLHGGTNAISGKQSVLKMDSIVAINFNKSFKKKDYRPLLTNRTLFERDRYLCAYCGKTHPRHKLTRDHVHPISDGGLDMWENCVTACRACNQYKGSKSLQKSGLELFYVPYAPSLNEHLILQNRKILTDQMEFLIKGVSKNSRLLLLKN